MPKVKTNRAAKKRFRVTASGKIKRGKAFRRHLLSSKSTTRKRGLRAPATVHASNVKAVEAMLKC